MNVVFSPEERSAMPLKSSPRDIVITTRPRWIAPPAIQVPATTSCTWDECFEQMMKDDPNPTTGR